MGFWVFFCVRDTAATRGQYLALSKAWWCCCFLVPPFRESCQLFEWSYDAVYARWAPQHRAVRYTVTVYRDGATVLKPAIRYTRQTFYLITGLQRDQQYNVTVTAFRNNRAWSKIIRFTCSGETGEDHCRVRLRLLAMKYLSYDTRLMISFFSTFFRRYW